MYKTVSEAVRTAEDLVQRVAGIDDVDVMIAPPFTALASVAGALRESAVALGAQNLHWEDEGAYTGEISAAMLLSAGCSQVIIGHSERRQFFGETDETVNQRIRTALQNHLVPVMCIGESEAERDGGDTFNVLDKQLEKGLKGFFSDDLIPLVVAYEPVWAIGTGKTATTQQAQEAHQFIRSQMDRKFGNNLAKSTRILYGGSVKPGNISELMQMPDVDGALVGGASLDASVFSQIVAFGQ
jgi:triosephosphate isomerase